MCFFDSLLSGRASHAFGSGVSLCRQCRTPYGCGVHRQETGDKIAERAKSVGPYVCCCGLLGYVVVSTIVKTKEAKKVGTK